MKDFTNRISFKISTGKLREKFELVQDGNGTVSSLSFQRLVRGENTFDLFNKGKRKSI